MKSYHNTVPETLDNVIKYEKKAEAQEKIVLKIFLDHPEGLTAEECYNLYPDFSVPLTSIRRAISNLSISRIVGYQGKEPIWSCPELEKLAEKRLGSFDRIIRVWRAYVPE